MDDLFQKKSYEFVYILQPAADCYCVIVCKMRTVLNVSRYWLRGFYQIRILLYYGFLHTKIQQIITVLTVRNKY